MKRFPRLPLRMDIKRLFWPKRFPRLKRFPRFRSVEPGVCYCGKRARNNLYSRDPLSKDKRRVVFRGFCSELCSDVYMAQVGQSLMWMKQRFDDIRQGRVDPGFYEIKRFLRRKE